MMEKLQKSLKVSRFLNLIMIALMICLLVGGYLVVQKITPAIGTLQEIQTSLKVLEQIDYQALNETLGELDVQALSEAIEQLDMDALNAKIDALDIESLNEALEGLDTEALSEALKNLNSTVDKLEKLGESFSSLGDWFGNKVKF